MKARIMSWQLHLFHCLLTESAKTHWDKFNGMVEDQEYHLNILSVAVSVKLKSCPVDSCIDESGVQGEGLD